MDFGLIWRADGAASTYFGQRFDGARIELLLLTSVDDLTSELVSGPCFTSPTLFVHGKPIKTHDVVFFSNSVTLMKHEDSEFI